MLIRLAVVLLAAVALCACSDPSSGDAGTGEDRGGDRAAADAPERSERRAAPPGDEPVPLTRVVGDLIMTKLDGPTASQDELAAVRARAIGGVILFGWNVQDREQLRALTESLQRARGGDELLVSVDQEGGPIRNVPFAPPEHTQPQLAAGPAKRVVDEAEGTGRALADAGVNMDLGPVADLAAGPNRTMAGRSFGEDAEQVAAHAGETVRGLQRGGVAAVAKHFPGFGASTANSDEAIAYVDRTREELEREELVPFRGAVAANVAAVMVSHGVHRDLGSELPGIVDARVATELLRQRVGFGGVAMTDSMNARGFREQWGGTVPKACPAALEAGIDLLLLTGTLETARLCRARILDAVRAGELSEDRVRQAVCRVSALRAAVRLRRPERTATLAADC